MFFKKERLDIYPALKNLYEISKNIQEDILHTNSKDISHLQFLKEFCTIRVATSRRGGHDLGLIKFLNKTKLQSFIILKDSNKRVTFNNNIKNSNNLHDLEIETYLHYQIVAGHKFYGKDLSYVDAIIINDAFFFSKEDERDIYEFVLRHFRITKPFYIIFVH